MVGFIAGGLVASSLAIFALYCWGCMQMIPPGEDFQQ